MFLKLVFKGNLPEDDLERKRPWRWFTKKTSLKLFCDGNLPEDGLQRKPL
jgi:hypothetical protein